MIALNSQQEILLRWWNLCLYPSENGTHQSLHAYASERLKDVGRTPEDYVEQLAGRLHKCKAKTLAQFRKWCNRQIDNAAAKLERQGTKRERKGTKAFAYEQHGDVCFIPLSDSTGGQHVWTIPADWLEEARSLWPVHIRRFSDGRPYVSRKVATANGQRNVPIHRLFLGLSAVRHEVQDNLESQNRDGSWLNYCDGNLSLVSGSDLFDHAKGTPELAEFVPLSAFDIRRVWRTPSSMDDHQKFTNFRVLTNS